MNPTTRDFAAWATIGQMRRQNAGRGCTHPPCQQSANVVIKCGGMRRLPAPSLAVLRRTGPMRQACCSALGRGAHARAGPQQPIRTSKDERSGKPSALTITYVATATSA